MSTKENGGRDDPSTPKSNWTWNSFCEGVIKGFKTVVDVGTMIITGTAIVFVLGAAKIVQILLSGDVYITFKV